MACFDKIMEFFRSLARNVVSSAMPTTVLDMESKIIDDQIMWENFCLCFLASISCICYCIHIFKHLPKSKARVSLIPMICMNNLHTLWCPPWFQTSQKKNFPDSDWFQLPRPALHNYPALSPLLLGGKWVKGVRVREFQKYSTSICIRKSDIRYSI